MGCHPCGISDGPHVVVIQVVVINGKVIIHQHEDVLRVLLVERRAVVGMRRGYVGQERNTRRMVMPACAMSLSICLGAGGTTLLNTAFQSS
jgi:hypothetical protein